MRTMVLAVIGLAITASHAWPVAARQDDPRSEPVGGIAGAIAVAPDARRLAIWAEGNLALFDVATAATRVLTTQEGGGPQYVLDAVFSPSGEQVAYSWNERNVNVLRVVEADGSGLRELLRDPAVHSISVKDWSPDGQDILAVLRRHDRSAHAVIIPAAGGPPRVILSLDAPAAELPGTMRFSRDGRYIAYDAGPRSITPSHDIFVIPAGGGAPVTLVRHDGDDRLLGWSPDGGAIVFASDRTGSVDIWLLPVADGAARPPAEPIMGDVGQLIPVGFAQDGSYYFATDTCRCRLAIAQLDSTSGRLQEPLELTGASVYPSGADWSPDGRYLAYLAATGGVLPPSRWRASGIQWQLHHPGWALAVRSAETGEERLLPARVDILHQLRPLWSPDGRRILVFGWDPDVRPRQVAYAIDVETGEATTLLRSESLWDWMFEWLAWSADGSAVFFTEYPTATTTRVVMRELASGRQRELFTQPSPPYPFGLAPSPDGESLAYATGGDEAGGSSLALRSLTRGETRTLLQRDIWPPAWSRDSRHLLYLADRQLWRIAVGGGEPERLGADPLFDDNWAGISVHPDGRRIAFIAVEERRAEVRVFRGLLPAR